MIDEFPSYRMGAPCPSNYNPADYYVQMLAVAPGKEDESRASIKKVCDTFAVGPIAKDIDELATMYKRNKVHSFLEPLEGVSIHGYRATWCTQFRAILWRSWLSVLKEPLLVKVRLLQTIVSIVGFYDTNFKYLTIFNFYRWFPF